jgi:hypothetical protein
MPLQDTVARRILEIVRANPECTLEELTLRLVELHWSDVFFGVDHLCRSGQLRLKQGSFGLTTTLKVIEPESRKSVNVHSSAH